MANRWIVAVILVTFVVLFSVLMVSLFWSPDTSATTTYKVTPLTSPVGSGYRCQEYECQQGLSCDSVSQQCRKNNGQRCSRATECLNGAYCSGVCVSEQPSLFTGLAGGPCPCGPTMTCVKDRDESGLHFCLKNEGQSCLQNSECLNSVCNGGFCAKGKSSGQSCSSSSECAQNNCSLGYCQPPGLITGQEASVCLIPGPPTCDPGMQCQQGLCRRVTQGLSEVCDLELSCMAPLTCYNDQNFSSCLPGSNCECQYNFSLETEVWRPNPNLCSLSGGCPTGMTCVEGRCLGLEGAPCTRSTECLFECLEFGGGIFSLVFEGLDLQQQPTVASTSPSLITGSYSVSGLKISSGVVPSGVADLTGYSKLEQASISSSSSTSSYPSSSEVASGVEIYYIVVGDSQSPSTTGLFDMRGRSVILGWSSTTTIQGDLTTRDERTFLWAQIWAPDAGLVAFRQFITYTTRSGDVDLVNTVSGDTIFIFNPSTGALAPLDTEGQLQGLQYLQDGSALTISRISASSSGDIMVQDRDQIVYVRPSGTSRYVRLVSSTTGQNLPPLSRPQYYKGSTVPTSPVVSSIPCYGNCPSYLDICYVSSYISPLTSKYQGQLVQFNGNAEGAVFPILGDGIDSYRVESYGCYSDPIEGISAGYLALTATNESNGRTSLMVAPSGRLSVLPGYTGVGTRILCLESGIYIYSSGICG